MTKFLLAAVSAVAIGALGAPAFAQSASAGKLRELSSTR
jgi:hypothetical protein